MLDTPELQDALPEKEPAVLLKKRRGGGGGIERGMGWVREEPPNALRSTIAPPDKNCCCCNLYISVRNLVPLGVCLFYI